MFIAIEYQTRTPPKSSENFYRQRAIRAPSFEIQIHGEPSNSEAVREWLYVPSYVKDTFQVV